MGRIQANTGLVTGIDIQGTVDKLIALQAIPRDAATNRLKLLTDRQTAIGDLTAAVIAIQLAAKNLGKVDLFRQTTVTSSNTGLLAAALSPSGSPTPGSYPFTPVRLAQAQHVLSQGFASKTSPIGAGVLTLRDGGALTSPLALSALNGGSGVERGKIRITDRSGATAVVDLRFAHTVDDVLAAINSNEAINVTARTVGDRIELVDNTGQSISNLRVQEVGDGSTATDLGLATINSAAGTALGSDVVGLYESLALSKLRDGTGLSFSEALPDLQVTFRDGSSPLDIDFKRLGQPAGQAQATVSAASGIHGDLLFTAAASGAAFDGVSIEFVAGAAQAGDETVVYDEQTKKLTFTIAEEATTANDILATLDRTPAVEAVFSAQLGPGSDGSGLIATSDTAITSGGAATETANEQTLGDLLATINAADPSRLQAQISADGERIELIDLTSGGGSFSIASINGSGVAEQLGVGASTAAGTISGSRLLGGLNTVLLSSLNGGQGLGPLGALLITDRSGASASVDLSGAETVDEVLAAINSAGIGVRAELNDAMNGIRIVDTTGAATSDLIVADGDATNSATKLGLAVNAAVDEKAGSDLHRQIVGRQTLLSEFNHGAGVRLGSIRITDSSGASSALNLSQLGAETIGDVLDAINNLSIGVEARINDTGDGIALVDTAAGSGKLQVEDVGNGKAAADLKIAGQSQTVTINGQPTEVIDGSTTVRIELDADDTLTDLAAKINEAKAGLNASIFYDGSTYRLSLVNSETGLKNAWVIDGSGLGIEFNELTAAQDALVAIGPPGAASLLVSSDSNVINDAVPGVQITLNGASTEPVTVTVSEDLVAITGKVKAFIEQYNKLIEKLDKYDFYQAEGNQKGVLYGSSETLRIKSDLSRLLSGRFVGSSFQSLGALGVGFKDDGTLEFNEKKFTDAYNADASGVEQFFTDATSGFTKQLDDVVERLAGVENSTLINRTIAMQAQVEQLSARIELMNFQLEKSKERLLLQFFRLESSIGKLQNTFGAIQSQLNNAVNLYENLK